MFDRTKNPVHLIQAFMLAHQAGIYPPLWVLNSLCEAFKGLQISGGVKSLDTLLGLRSGKKGNNSPSYKRAAREDREQIIMLNIHRLVVLGLDPERAIELIVLRLTREIDETAIGRRMFEVSTITRRWMLGSLEKDL